MTLTMTTVQDNELGGLKSWLSTLTSTVAAITG